MAAESENKDNQKVPYLQSLMDRPFLLLFAGMLVMIVFYTLWGIYDIYSLPTGDLP